MAVGLALVALGATASLAHADDSQLKIKEVYSDGNTTNTPAGHADYVELQLSQPGQFIGDGHSVVVYNAAGTVQLNFQFGPDAANILTDNQRTILLGWPSNPTADFVPTGNFVNPQLIGGAVCLAQQAGPPLVPIDCMSWGSFPVGTSIALGAGTPAPALNASQALTRSFSANCPTLLEPADDTNNSAADFSLTTPSPRNNGTAPTETPCPAPVTPVTTTTTKKCKKKKKHHASAVAAKKKCKKKKKH